MKKDRTLLWVIVSVVSALVAAATVILILRSRRAKALCEACDDDCGYDADFGEEFDLSDETEIPVEE